jgi:hypothetical protein
MAKPSVRAYLIKNPQATTDEVAKATGKSRATIYSQRWILKKQLASGVGLASLKARRGRPRKQRPIMLDEIKMNPDTVAKLVVAATTGKRVTDAVNHPPHYTDGGVEVIDFIEAKRLGYHLGNVVKYICRAGKKGTNSGMEDLRKAQWYLKRAIERNEVYPSNK